jgi:hypothetical protein
MNAVHSCCEELTSVSLPFLCSAQLLRRRSDRGECERDCKLKVPELCRLSRSDSRMAELYTSLQRGRGGVLRWGKAVDGSVSEMPVSETFSPGLLGRLEVPSRTELFFSISLGTTSNCWSATEVSLLSLGVAAGVWVS